MSMKAGQIVFDANGFIVDRIQTGGVSALNIPTTKIDEVGDFLTVDVVRDNPDLTFDINSVDVSTDFEAIATDISPGSVTTGPSGTEIDFLNAMPLDVISDFRSGNNRFNIVRGVVIPYLTLETVAYKYGLKANAEQTFTYRGDAMYYIPGIPWRDTAAGGSATYNFANGPAIVYHEATSGGIANIYAVSVCWHDPTTGLYKRLFHGTDYTDSTTGITLVGGAGIIPGTAVVSICYGSAVAKTITASQSSETTAVKPGAVRSKNIDIYIGSGGATPVMSRLSGVQSFDVTRKVTLQNDEEFGNPHYVSTDYDVPDVTGTIGIKGIDPLDVIAKIQQLAGVPTNEISGPLTSPELQLEARISHPVTGVLLKTIYIPDATFTAPPMQGRVKQRLESSFKFDSTQGILKVYKGAR